MDKDQLKKYIRKLVKEAINNQPEDIVMADFNGDGESDGMSESIMGTAPKTWEGKPEEIKENKTINSHYKLKNGKPVQKEHLQVCKVVLESRSKLIESMISEKGLMDKIGSAFGRVNPSLDVDNPKFAKKELEKSMNDIQKIEKLFQASALKDTALINKYHDVVLAALDKFASLSDSLTLDDGQIDVQARDEMEDRVIDAAKRFYELLVAEKGRLDSYTKLIYNDLAKSGHINKVMKSMMSKSKKMPSKEPELDKSTLKRKGEVPVDSIGSALKGMATNWAK